MEKLLQNAAADDLNVVLGALGKNLPEVPEVNVHSLAARKIYQMRNSLVHYRSAQRKIDHRNVDWNRLCKSVADLVYHIYSAVFAV